MTGTATAPDIRPADFDFVRQFLKREAAIALDDGKEYLVTSRLGPLVRSHGFVDLAALVEALRADPRAALGGDVVDAMTTNETSFFRDVHPFQSFRETILPEVIETRAATKRLRIWCGASSSGQEPYSVAMTIRDHFPALAGWDVTILASDISPTMLAKAEKGEYSQLEVNRGLPAPMLINHFVRRGARWQLSEEVRGMVDFQRVNLAAPWPAWAPFDVIFLRNVLIYFDEATKTDILRRTHGALSPGGHVLLGGAETTVGLNQQQLARRMLGRSVWYRRT